MVAVIEYCVAAVTVVGVPLIVQVEERDKPEGSAGDEAQEVMVPPELITDSDVIAVFLK